MSSSQGSFGMTLATKRFWASLSTAKLIEIFPKFRSLMAE